MMARQAELEEEIGFKLCASEGQNKEVIVYSELFCQSNIFQVMEGSVFL